MTWMLTKQSGKVHVFALLFTARTNKLCGSMIYAVYTKTVLDLLCCACYAMPAVVKYVS